MPDSVDNDLLFRLGRDFETASDLESQCEAATANGFPHGISLLSRSSHPEAVSAARSSIEIQFRVLKTGKSPFHFTLELPHPVTDAVALKVNPLFGQRK